jgi:predicted metal-dependent phosphoesterase TrpH
VTNVLKIDLHLHTAEDPLDRIDHDAHALIDRAAALGFDAIAITLHDRQLADARVDAHARERGIVLLRGIERTIGRKHVLLINFPPAAEQVRTFDELAALKARSDGIVIAPHPFFPAPSCLRSTLDRRPDLFDGVEWSYFWTRGADFNSRAARWARAHGKALVGNSDLHDLRQLGRTFSLVRADRRADAICQAIRDGCVSLQTAPVPADELVSVLGRMAIRGPLLSLATSPFRLRRKVRPEAVASL